MSRTAWMTLCASGVFTCGVIYYVHTSQTKDRERLREGVIIDMERQQRKRQNIQQLALQADLTKILREQQKQYDEEDKRHKESGSGS
ncbi:protein pet117 homolog, mitochondrial [Plakobranchus ocellatus]|uniref:Protein pet117 homolog, mitochondrial n=1 Tax=Plakobranchus ocellatus TaxID=259542 RepID=A0AAV3ZN53_9GAST|nr:protein pet117 homolog, mitochondrial [Plakobranchus ocellatus]